MRVSVKALVLILVLAIPTVASAGALQLDTIRALLDERERTLRADQAKIRAGVEAGAAHPYRELSAAMRTELLSRQAKVLELINGKHSESELTDEQRTEVATTLAWIDTKLKEAEDDRMVCERRQILGSNRKERVCMTAAQLRAQREAARQTIDPAGIKMGN